MVAAYRGRWLVAAVALCVLGLRAAGAGELAAPAAGRARQAGAGAQGYRDGHTRPRALAVDARGDLLYVALSTGDQLAVIDVSGATARRLFELPICAFPAVLAPLPAGGVVVSCRFDPLLRIVSRTNASAAHPTFRIRAVDTGPEHGNRGVALDAAGRTAYVASAARGGVKIVDLWRGNAPVRFVATGLFPEVVRFVPGGEGTGLVSPLLLVANFVGHTVGVYPVSDDGGLGPALQSIETAAPVRDLVVVPPRPGRGDAISGLVLATHEDRALSREHLSVEGLDSVLLLLPFAPSLARGPFTDLGPGKRRTVNLCERAGEPVVSLEAMAVDLASGRIALVGAGSDNVLLSTLGASSLVQSPVTSVGANPSAVAFLPGGRVVTADRLSDTLSFVGVRGDASSGDAILAVETLVVGKPEWSTPAERGELLFHSRALVPNNVATGPLSLYTCAGCHADGHIDGRLHPSKRNRFYSMTKTCRGLAGTEPFLSLGHPDTFAAFADNIVATHAQGALDAPGTYDQYAVALRLREKGRWRNVRLSPSDIRAALAAYMARIPIEPSPFSGHARLTESEARGLEVFRASCSGCHQLLPSTSATRPVAVRELPRRLRARELVLTSARRYDVGTPVLGEGGNNPPSLRGTWAAAPYFTDGSAATLEDVIRRTDPNAEKVHAAQNATLAPAFSPADQAALAAFLRGL